MKFAARTCFLICLPSALAFVAGCGGKSKFSGKTASESALNRVADSGASSASSSDSTTKSNDSLQAELERLKAKLDSFYKDYVSFKSTVDSRFKDLEEKLQAQIDDLKSDLAKVEARVSGLENWRDGDYKTTIDGLIRSIGTINATIKTMNATADATTSRIDSLEIGIDNRLNLLSGRIDGLTTRVADSEKALRDYKEEAARTFATNVQLTGLAKDIEDFKKYSAQKYATKAEFRAHRRYAARTYATLVKVGAIETSLNQVKVDLSAVSVDLSDFKDYAERTYAAEAKVALLEKDLELLTNDVAKAATKRELDALQRELTTYKNYAARTFATKAELAALEKELEDFKTQAAETYATKAELSAVRDDVAALNESLLVMYTELTASDAALAARNEELTSQISGVASDLQGLRGEFAAHVKKYNQEIRSLGNEMRSKIRGLRAEMLRKDRANVRMLRAEMRRQASEFGARLNTYSVSLNRQLNDLRKTVGENHADFVRVSRELREAQALHQQEIADLGKEIAEVQERLSEVEVVAANAMRASQANERNLGLLSRDFETQKKAVAERFDLNESKIDSVKADLAEFKRETNQRFEQVRQEAAAMVAHLDRDTQRQFSTLSGRVASLRTQVNAHDRAIGTLTQKVGSLEGSVDYLVKAQAFERAYGQKVDVSMDGVKALIIALVDVEQAFVKSLQLSRQNRGPFDPRFRAELSLPNVCGTQDPELDFARASEVDYFRWIAQVYVRNLVFNMRTASPDANRIFHGRGLLVERGSLLSQVMHSVLRLEGRGPVPAGCFAAIEAFSQRALLGDDAGSLDLRTRLIGQDLADAIRTLEQRITYVKGPMGDLERWLAEELKALKGDDLEMSRAEIAQSIFSRAKAVLDINDRRAEMTKFAELSIEMTLNSMHDEQFRRQVVAQLNGIRSNLDSQLASLNQRITAFAGALSEADRVLKASLEAQVRAVRAQAESTQKQLEILNGVVQENVDDLRARQNSLATEMRLGFSLLNDKVDGVAAEVGALERARGVDLARRDEALRNIFSILATMAARAGDAAMLEIINEAGFNFSGEIPRLLQNYKPVVNLVQHYFTGGFVKGTAAACLSLDESTIRRSPFDWLCNVNFRRLTVENRVGTASTAVIRTHGAFSFIDVEAWRSNVWSWKLDGALVTKTYSGRYRTPMATGIQDAKILTEVIGNGTAYGSRGVYDLPDGGALMASLIDPSLQQFNGVIKIRPGRMANPIAGVDEAGGGYEVVTVGEKKEYRGPEVKYIVGLYSPIVLNFGADELKTVRPSESKVRFDLNANGIQESTGWIPTSGAGFLALPTEKGEIVNGEQLFGQATKLGGSDRRAANGYEALAQYDTARKGYIDASDPVFGKLVVWFDRNSDGIASASEKVPLSRLGVTRIATTYSERPLNAQYQGEGILDSNQLKYESVFWGPKECGAKGCSSYDVYFGASEFSSASK